MAYSKPGLIDIGANLSHSSFSHDLEQVLASARQAGIEHIIVTGTDLESIEAGITLAELNQGFLSCTAGFHPHVASQFLSGGKVLQHRLTSLANHDAVVSVGETGLDFNRNYSPRSDQEDAFVQHLELASQINKPVFLHQRDAHESFKSILKQFRDDICDGVVHCFTDNRQALFDYLDLDMYIGITGWICDERRGSELQDLVQEIPQDRLLIETDAPYLLPRTLSPKPKNRRNEPAYLPEVVRFISQCRGESVEFIRQVTTQNARRLFQLSEQPSAS